MNQGVGWRRKITDNQGVGWAKKDNWQPRCEEKAKLYMLFLRVPSMSPEDVIVGCGLLLM